MKALLQKLFAIKTIGQRTQYDGYPDVYFYKQAAAIGSHGQVLVSSPKHGLVQVPVNFVFAGHKHCLPLTAANVNYIYHRAAEAGYVVHEIVEYGKIVVPCPEGCERE